MALKTPRHPAHALFAACAMRVMASVGAVVSPLRLAPVVVLGAMMTQPAAAMDKPALIAAMQVKYGDVKTISAGFTQTTRSDLFGDEVVKGEVMLKRPGKMKWSFGKEKSFITDGQKMWIYTVEDKQVIEYDDISQNRSSAENLLTSLDQLEQKFEVKLVSSDDTAHVVELRPRGEDQFKKVVLTLDGAMMVKQVVITDTFDNVTDIAFTNVTLNAPIDDAVFVFKTPAGVELIKAN